MLRLRPSEITLTPADVEETYRRMVRNQTRASAAMNHTLGLPSSSSGPKLRRGPNRSREDALSRLGSIPILRPQQAVPHAMTSLPDDEISARSDGAGEIPEEGTLLVHRVSGSSLDLSRQTTRDGNQALFGSLPPAMTFERPQGHLPRFTEEPADSVEQRIQPSPSKHSRVSAVRRRSSESSGDVEASSTQPLSQQDGISGESPSPPANMGSETLHTQAVQVLPRHPDQSSRRAGHNSSRSEELPTLYLRGRFQTPEHYIFDEFRIANTEPQQDNRRVSRRIRHVSSSSDPSQLLTFNTARTRLDDTLWRDGASTESADRNILPSPQPHSAFDDRIQGARRALGSLEERAQSMLRRARQRNGNISARSGLAIDLRQRLSETSSNSSLPYSYYELPNSSRQSSDGNPNNVTQLHQSQLDGAAPSRHASRGAYYSIRPSQISVNTQPAARAARVSSFSSPDLPSSIGRQGHSPLPAQPYSRGSLPHDQPRPTLGLINPNDFASDVITAIERALPSPLELLEQRGTAQLARLSRQSFSNIPPQSNSDLTTFRLQVEDFDHEERYRRRANESLSIRRESGNNAYPRTATPRPQPPLPYVNPQNLSVEEVVRLDPQNQRRLAVGTRSGQRSSENVPVSVATVPSIEPILQTQHHERPRINVGRRPQPSTSHGVSMRGGQVQSSPIRNRFSMPSSPRDVVVRSQQSHYTRRSIRNLSTGDEVLSSSPISRRQNQNQNLTFLRSSSRFDAMRGDRVVRTYNPRMARHTDERFQAPVLHHDPSFLHRGAGHHEDRASLYVPSTFNSRRPPIPARVASRRISARQQNQENSGNAEAGLMREEMASVAVRHADDGAGLDVMDETPPPLGRFERHMIGN